MGRERLAYHWIAPLAFIPFGLMLIVHRSLGMSDALLAASKPAQPFWPRFNVAMIVVFYLGVGGYLAHTFWLAAGAGSRLSSNVSHWPSLGRAWLWRCNPTPSHSEGLESAKPDRLSQLKKPSGPISRGTAFRAVLSEGGDSPHRRTGILPYAQDVI
jgi:hypothetical protein